MGGLIDGWMEERREVLFLFVCHIFYWICSIDNITYTVNWFLMKTKVVKII